MLPNDRQNCLIQVSNILESVKQCSIRVEENGLVDHIFLFPYVLDLE